MKNLKKVLALVVVFSMMLCSVAFAAFPDVAEDADYANAVNTLAALDIIGGDDLGNFNPDNTITRAEFTKIVCEMQGLKGDANKGVTAFADVAADHWASGYINMATNMGIINGMGDGTFAPSNPVTYEQAIKMIVVALGYEPMAAEKGGYPTGYLVAAQSCGLTKGIAAPAQADAAKRSLIAELVYNALDVPMMERVGYGSEASYEIKNGDEGARVTLLTSKFDVVKLGGVVIANEKVAITVTEDGNEANGVKADGEITLLYDNNYKSTNEDFEVSENIKKNTINANVAETNADDFFGVRVIAYIQENGREYDVIAIVAEEGKSNVVSFSTIDIDSISDDEIAYFESETARKATALDLVASIPVIWNSTSGKTVADILDIDGAAKITLTDWDADEVYDMIKVDEVKHYVVKTIDADIYTIETLDGESLVLDPDEDEVKITVEDKDGAAVDFEDIAVGDVLAVLSDNDSVNPDEFMDIIVLGQNSVEGVVKSSGKTAGVQKVSIDGTTYKVSTEIAEGEIAVGNEGTFYLGSSGEIIAFDGSKASFGSYAIILNTDLVASGDWGNSAVRFINSDGVIDADTTFATTVKVVNGAGDYKNCKVDTALDSLLAGTEFASCEDFADLVEALPLPASYTDAELAARVVQVKVNANKEITQITFAGNDTFDVSDIEEDAEYNATTNKFAGFGKINDSTLIFSINNNDIKKTRIAALDSFIDDAKYTVVGFDEDDNGVYGAILVLDGGDSLAGSVKGMAIVTGISTTTDANGDDAIELTVVSDNEKDAKAILVTAETGVDRDFNATGTAMGLVEAMDLGSLLLYSADANGNVLTLASIANVNEDGDAYELVSADTVGDIEFVYGITAGRLTNDLAIEDGNADEITISSSTNKYRYNNANARNIRIEVGSYKGGNVVTADEEEGNFVFAMIVDEDTVDIISIDTPILK